MDDAIRNKVVLGCSAFAPGPAGSPISPQVLWPRSCPFPVVLHPGRHRQRLQGQGWARGVKSRHGTGRGAVGMAAPRTRAASGPRHRLRWPCAGRDAQRAPEQGRWLHPRVKPCREREEWATMLQGTCARACVRTPAVGVQGLPGGSRAHQDGAGPGSSRAAAAPDPQAAPLVKPFLASSIPNISHFSRLSLKHAGSRLWPSPPRGTDPAPTSLRPPHPSATRFTDQ